MSIEEQRQMARNSTLNEIRRIVTNTKEHDYYANIACEKLADIRYELEKLDERLGKYKKIK